MLTDNTGVLEKSKREVKKSTKAKEPETKTVKESKKSDTHILAKSIKEAPIVDKTKVQAIKEKLANMEFAINPQRIADKLLAFESDLFPASPKLKGK